MTRFALPTLVAVMWVGSAVAADAPTKEPKYAGKPVYAAIAFGPTPADKVWLALDGDTLYVDRTGPGDLTAAGSKVPAELPRHGRPRDDADGYNFLVGGVTVNGRTHQNITLYVSPLKGYADSYADSVPGFKEVLKADPAARAYRLNVSASRPGLAGGDPGGRVGFTAGPVDATGVLQFAATPAAAPVVRTDTRLELRAGPGKLTLRAGRTGELMLEAGCPGTGPGSFNCLMYDGTIPKDAAVAAEVTFPPRTPGDPPTRVKYELPERC